MTYFFRDPEAFELLKKQYIPYLYKKNEKSKQIRVWVSTCSSGEEAYSLAILLKEYEEKTKEAYDITIFASDTNKSLLSMAMRGEYNESSMIEVSYERREKFFLKRKDHYLVRSDLKDIVAFGLQNLFKDPPFTNLDLISCRNILLDIKAETWQKIIKNLHFGLNEGSLLFLGPRAHVGNFSYSFSAGNKMWSIYKKKNNCKQAISKEKLQVAFEEAEALNKELMLRNEQLHLANEKLYVVSSERQRKVEALTRREDEFDDITQSSHIGVIILDENRRITKINSSITKSFEILIEDYGRSIENFLFKFQDDQFLSSLNEAYETRTIQELETLDINFHYMLTKIVPINSCSERSDVAIIFINVSYLKTNNLTLGSDELSEFSYLISHELKAILNNIEDNLGIAGIREESIRSTLFFHVNNISKVVNSLEHFSSLTKENLEMKPCFLGDIIKEVIDDFKVSPAFQKAEIRYEGVFPTLNIDAMKMSEVFYSLIKNSVIFNKSSVKKVSIICDLDEANDYIFAIKDNGIDEIFKKIEKPDSFRRGESVELVFAKKIIELHDGRVWFEKNVDEEGSTFFFSMPKSCLSVASEIKGKSQLNLNSNYLPE